MNECECSEHGVYPDALIDDVTGVDPRTDPEDGLIVVKVKGRGAREMFAEHGRCLDAQMDLIEKHRERIKALSRRFDRLEALEAHNGNQLNVVDDLVSELVNKGADTRRRVERLEAKVHHPSAGYNWLGNAAGGNPTPWTNHHLNVGEHITSVSVKAGTSVTFR